MIRLFLLIAAIAALCTVRTESTHEEAPTFVIPNAL